MNYATDPDESRSRNAGPITKWIAAAAAGLCALNIALNLTGGTTTDWVTPRIVLQFGVVLVMGSLVATNKAAKVVLAVCGAILAVGAYLFRWSGS